MYMCTIDTTTLNWMHQNQSCANAESLPSRFPRWILADTPAVLLTTVIPSMIPGSKNTDIRLSCKWTKSLIFNFFSKQRTEVLTYCVSYIICSSCTDNTSICILNFYVKYIFLFNVRKCFITAWCTKRAIWDAYEVWWPVYVHRSHTLLQVTVQRRLSNRTVIIIHVSVNMNTEQW